MDDSGVYGFVVFSVLVVIGIAMFNNIITNNTNVSSATTLNSYQFNFSQNPTDGQIITMDNTTFEFDNNSNVANGSIAIQIGSATNDSVANLKQALQANPGYVVN